MVVVSVDGSGMQHSSGLTPQPPKHEPRSLLPRVAQLLSSSSLAKLRTREQFLGFSVMENDFNDSELACLQSILKRWLRRKVTMTEHYQVNEH